MRRDIGTSWDSKKAEPLSIPVSVHGKAKSRIIEAKT